MKPHPTSFGVFNPVGHVVISFPTAADAQGARSALLEAGFENDDLVSYTPQEMQAQAEFDIGNATVLASIGQDLNLVKAHRELASRGHGFLVVRTPHDAQVERVTQVARSFNAGRAQRYGRLLVEELLEVGSTEQQVPESPDRGLDAQTASGREGGV